MSAPHPANTAEELRAELWEVFKSTPENNDGRGTVNHFFDVLIPFIQDGESELYAALEAPENRLTWKHDDGTETEYVKLSALRKAFNMKEE